MEYKQLVLTFTATKEMSPLTKIVVYFIQDGEVVADSTSFQVAQTFDNQVQSLRIIMNVQVINVCFEPLGFVINLFVLVTVNIVKCVNSFSCMKRLKSLSVC